MYGFFMVFHKHNCLYMDYMIVWITQYLKEQCREEFAVYGQFCANIITLRLQS